MGLYVGQHVRRIRDGRSGTISRSAGRHNGFWVVWDGPSANPFDIPEARVQPFYLEPTDAAEAEAFEAVWPSFARRDREQMRRQRDMWATSERQVEA